MQKKHIQEHIEDVAPPQILPPPTAPMAVARTFVARHCTHESGVLILRYWRDGWWAWRRSHWEEIDRRQVRSLLYTFTEHALYAADDDLRPWAPNRHKIGDLLEALGPICILDDKTDQPSWLDGRTKSTTIVALDNGLLDVEQRLLLPHTPLFFNQTAVPFPYDAGAPQPAKWFKFLNELWKPEPQSIAPEIAVLSEWFGYVISGRTDLHKILLMVGPTRGGKGAIARVLTALIGPKNCAGPTLNSLSGDFGRAPLIGKPLAIISDARIPLKGDTNVVVERLLSISGEDSITVNRKYREQWTGKLPSRFHIISNELPRLGDASAAIIGRLILLLTSQSWLGKEDHALEAQLHEELPGILNWSLDGLNRLTITNKNQFSRLPAAEEEIIAMRDLASPVAAFVREKCVTGVDKKVDVDDLYIEFKHWAEDNGHMKSSKPVFGRNLRAAVLGIKRGQEGTKSRKPVYFGIGLRESATAANYDDQPEDARM